MTKHTPSVSRKIAYYSIALVVFLLFAELFSAALFFYRYKPLVKGLERYSGSSLVMLAEKVTNRYGNGALEPVERTSDPSPLFINDPVQGYVNNPGEYRISFYRTIARKKTQQKVTILRDGSRYTGSGDSASVKGKPRIHLYGDSWVFGWGVNDEQTFSYLLQKAHPETHVGLFAAGGYSLSNAYRNFQKHKSLLDEDDIVVLGYTDYYKVRDVAAPSRLREFSSIDNRWFRNRNIRHLKADLDEQGGLRFSLVPLLCSEMSDGYCDKPDPSPDYMNRVTSTLINDIARGTKARVYLLFMSGDSKDPVFSMLDSRVTVINARSTDFSYDIMDDVMGYDAHPGPYWHYGIYTLLNGVLNAGLPLK